MKKIMATILIAMLIVTALTASACSGRVKSSSSNSSLEISLPNLKDFSDFGIKSTLNKNITGELYSLLINDEELVLKWYNANYGFGFSPLVAWTEENGYNNNLGRLIPDESDYVLYYNTKIERQISYTVRIVFFNNDTTLYGIPFVKNELYFALTKYVEPIVDSTKSSAEGETALWPKTEVMRNFGIDLPNYNGSVSSYMYFETSEGVKTITITANGVIASAYNDYVATLISEGYTKSDAKTYFKNINSFGDLITIEPTFVDGNSSDSRLVLYAVYHKNTGVKSDWPLSALAAKFPQVNLPKIENADSFDFVDKTTNTEEPKVIITAYNVSLSEQANYAANLLALGFSSENNEDFKKTDSVTEKVVTVYLERVDDNLVITYYLGSGGEIEKKYNMPNKVCVEWQLKLSGNVSVSFKAIKIASVYYSERIDSSGTKKQFYKHLQNKWVGYTYANGAWVLSKIEFPTAELVESEVFGFIVNDAYKDFTQMTREKNQMFLGLSLEQYTEKKEQIIGNSTDTYLVNKKYNLVLSHEARGNVFTENIVTLFDESIDDFGDLDIPN